MKLKILAATVALTVLSTGALGALPDPKLTPGDIATTDVAQICTKGYAKRHRDVSQALKEKVYQAYKHPHIPGQTKIDHLISLQLGGSNAFKNLWPVWMTQGEWPGKKKDALENKLHYLVCTNKLDIKTAQYKISKDWVQAYKEYMK